MPNVMLIDMNSFFASVEQQANPFLRGLPVGVVASMHPTSCIIAASIEAKQLGIGTGTLIYQAKKIYPKIVLLKQDPEKYREVSRRIVRIFYDYTDRVEQYSIDEAFLEVGYFPPRIGGNKVGRDKAYSLPPLTPPVPGGEQYKNPLLVAIEIKHRIKEEVGEWLTCSVGIAPNKFMAKLAADLQKPDGLTIMWRENLPEVYKDKKLTDLWGISRGWERRLAKLGIVSPLQLLNYSRPSEMGEARPKGAALQNLISLFGKPGFWLWQRVNGLERDEIRCNLPLLFRGGVGEEQQAFENQAYPTLTQPLPPDGREGEEKLQLTSSPKSFGHSWVLNFRTTDKEKFKPVILYLAEKAARRMRAQGFGAQGIYLRIRLVDGSSFAKSKKLKFSINTGMELYEQALVILNLLARQSLGVGGIQDPQKRDPDFRQDCEWAAQPSRETIPATSLNNDQRFPAEVMHISVGFTHLVEYSGQLELGFEFKGRASRTPQPILKARIPTSLSPLATSPLKGESKSVDLLQTLDYLNNKYGEFTIRSGLLTYTQDYAPDAIAFGR